MASKEAPKLLRHENYKSAEKHLLWIWDVLEQDERFDEIDDSLLTVLSYITEMKKFTK